MKQKKSNETAMAHHIARPVEHQILQETGLGISKMLSSRKDQHTAQERLLRTVAQALEMSPDCYRMKTRQRNISELRFLGAHFLRRHFPNITLMQIAKLFGGLDHTSVISGLARASNLICTRDERFIKKYNSVLKSLEPWSIREASACELAVSA